MATITTILMGVISLLGKQNKLTCGGVLVVGGGKRTLHVFFFAKKAQNEHWEVVVDKCCPWDM
jgi:hypothetical protein